MSSSVIDLTHVLREGMIGHASHGRTPVKLTGSLSHRAYAHGQRTNPYDGGKISFANEQWVINGNTGTHMDSVWHANPESPYTAEHMPVHCGLGSAIVLDASVYAEPAGELSRTDLENAERASGSSILRGDIVLVNTGSSRRIQTDPDGYLSKYTGLSKEAGEWLRARGARTVGIDSPNVDSVTATYTSPVHMNFLRPTSLGLGQEDFIAIIENLTNLDAIPCARFDFIGLPLPLEGGSGSPIRAIAVLRDKPEETA